MTPTAATTATPTISYTTLDSPLGELLLVGEESPTAPGGTALVSLSMPRATGRRHRAAALASRRPAPSPRSVRQLRAYFAGELTRFALEFRTTGTEFQERVWRPRWRPSRTAPRPPTDGLPRPSAYRAATYGP